MPRVTHGPQPDRRPEPVFRNRVECREPENLVRDLRGCEAQGLHATLRRRADERPELRPVEFFGEGTRYGVLEIGLDFLPPHGPALVAEIDLEEPREILLGRHHLGISVRNERGTFHERFMERGPAYELHACDRDGFELYAAVDFVDPQLVRDEEIGRERLVRRAARAAIRHLDEFGGFLRECIERLPRAAHGSQEKPSEESRPGEREQPAVRARDGLEARNAHGLVAIHDPHDGELFEEAPVAVLQDEPPLIPTHGAPHSFWRTALPAS